jgi:hypothetical protein
MASIYRMNKKNYSEAQSIGLTNAIDNRLTVLSEIIRQVARMQFGKDTIKESNNALMTIYSKMKNKNTR